MTGPQSNKSDRPATPPRFARSGQMVDCLRRESLYSEKRPRDLLFDAIEGLVAVRPALMVSQLTRQAAAAARGRAEAANFTFANWDAAGRAVVNAMLTARALLDAEGRAIPPGITAQAAPAGGVRDGFRDITEAFLLEFLIRRLDNVTTRDHTALAHALFRQFDARVSRDELEDRVVVLLAQLAGRVTLKGDTYVARRLD